MSRLLDYWAYFDTLRIMPSNWDIFYCTHPDIDPRYWYCGLVRTEVTWLPDYNSAGWRKQFSGELSYWIQVRSLNYISDLRIPQISRPLLQLIQSRGHQIKLQQSCQQWQHLTVFYCLTNITNFPWKRATVPAVPAMSVSWKVNNTGDPAKMSGSVLVSIKTRLTQPDPLVRQPRSDNTEDYQLSMIPSHPVRIPGKSLLFSPQSWRDENLLPVPRLFPPAEQQLGSETASVEAGPELEL